MKRKTLAAVLLAVCLLLSACRQGATADTAAGNGGSTAGAEDSSTDGETGAAAENAGSQGDSGTSSGLPEEMPVIFTTFSTTDLEGNSVDESILQDYKLTMFNVWATYCGPCLMEMPDLGELAPEYAEKGVQFVGLVSDTLNSDGSISESQVDTARDIVEETGADYLHLLPSEDLMDLLSQIYAVPTTIIVDQEGRQVGYAYVQSLSREEWVAVLDAALAEVEE